MDAIFECCLQVLLIGAGATVTMDVGGLALKRAAGIPFPNYALVGRWIASMTKGRFHHASITASPSIPGERVIGWLAHYAIGVAFASVLLLIWGLPWACNPTIGPALIVGLGSVVAPFFLMQPGMGAGIASCRTPHPPAARIRSLGNHFVFGLGLYASGHMTALLCACQ